MNLNETFSDGAWHRMMNILLVNNSDEGGGAERIAMHLLDGYNRAGHQAWMAVGHKKTNHNRVFQIENEKHRSRWSKFMGRISESLNPLQGKIRGIGRMKRWASDLGQPIRTTLLRMGREDFGFPGTRHLLDNIPVRIDLIHAHNLHGDGRELGPRGYGAYFDLRCLKTLSRRIPVAVTLHDAWLLSGHCSHSLDCDKWKTGCGKCPDLNLYPAIRRDGTAANWSRKRTIYQKSRLFVATPCQWLMDKAQQSMLASGIHAAKVVPNGIPLNCFHPAVRTVVREKLGIHKNSKVVLFVANGVRHNSWKDYKSAKEAVLKAGALLPNLDILFICLGDEAPDEKVGNVRIRFIPFTNQPEDVAAYYQSAEVYIHAAHVDTFPNTILEALACGVPVIATAVGGIPEQIVDGENGFIVAPRDVLAIATHLTSLLTDARLLNRMAATAVEIARKQYGLDRMVNDYTDWFSESVLAGS